MRIHIVIIVLCMYGVLEIGESCYYDHALIMLTNSLNATIGMECSSSEHDWSLGPLALAPQQFQKFKVCPTTSKAKKITCTFFWGSKTLQFMAFKDRWRYSHEPCFKNCIWAATTKGITIGFNEVVYEWPDQ